MLLGCFYSAFSWTDLSINTVFIPWSLNSMGKGLENFFFYYYFLQLCKHVWLKPGINYRTIPYIYICTHYIISFPGTAKKSLLYFYLCKNYIALLVSSLPESAAFSFQAADGQPTGLLNDSSCTSFWAHSVSIWSPTPQTCQAIKKQPACMF